MRADEVRVAGILICCKLNFESHFCISASGSVVVVFTPVGAERRLDSTSLSL